MNRDRSYALGDIITAVQEKQVDTIAKLLARLDDFQAGQSVKITIMRNEVEREVTIALSSEQ